MVVSGQTYRHTYMYQTKTCDNIDKQVPVQILSVVAVGKQCYNVSCNVVPDGSRATQVKCTHSPTPSLVPKAEFLETSDQADSKVYAQTGVCVSSGDGKNMVSFKFSCTPLMRKSCNADCSSCQDNPLPFKSTCVNFGITTTKPNTTNARASNTASSQMKNAPFFVAIATAATAALLC